jgi:hypothetical protein
MVWSARERTFAPDFGTCEVAGIGGAVLVPAEPGEARDGAQCPELGFLLRGDVQGLAIQFLGGFGMPSPQ